MKKFSIEDQYRMYLKKSGLNEASMHPTQRTETKRAFMAGFGQALIVARDGVGAIANEKEAVASLVDLHDQVRRFWLLESSNFN